MNVGLIGIHHETSQSPILSVDPDTDPDLDPEPDSNQLVLSNLWRILHLSRFIQHCGSTSKSRSRNENHRVSRQERSSADKGPDFLCADDGTDVALCLSATLSKSSFQWGALGTHHVQV